MNSAKPDTKKKQEHSAIPLDCIRVDSVLDFDLFIRVNGQMVLYRSADLPFTELTRQKLLENRVDRLFITDGKRANYQRYIERNLDKVLADPEITEEKKATILYETSTELIKDVFQNPTYGDNIQRSKSLVSNTITYVLSGREAFHNLLRITSFDYYTYTHSVNVATFSIALAQQLGFEDDVFIRELGIGALLHDVGKARVPNEILNKRTSLSPSEFEIMKQHPKWGVEILSGSDELSADAYYPVLQHHERGDRGGYPNNLSLDEMHYGSRMVAIADTFDAMTTNRVYQRAMDTYDVLKVMFSLQGAYDYDMLMAFVELMGPKGLDHLK